MEADPSRQDRAAGAVAEEDDGVMAELSAVAEAEELDALVQGVVTSASADAAFSAFPRWKEILTKYQEMSQLLDPHLEGLIMPLAAALNEEATRQDGADIGRVQGICRMVEAVSNARGWKTVVKFFPNDAACLEPVTFLLHKVEAEGREKTTVDDEKGGTWESMCTLLLWLSMLVLIPFDLSSVDTSQSVAGMSEKSLVDTIIDKCKELLTSAGKVREMAAVLLARLLTRPDTTKQLDDFLEWSSSALAGFGGPEDVFLVPAVAHTSAAIFKLGSRDALLPYASKVWAQAAALSRRPELQSHALARKLAVKLLQRVALTFLEPRRTAWRYERSSTSLSRTLGGEAAHEHGSPGLGAGGAEAEEEEEEFEVAEEIEEGIDLLLQGLRDKDTIVRWSSAKGLGRVLGRLPKDLGDEVVGCVTEILVPTESDSAWHGACLALAELVRRGLLLPERLPETVPLVAEALRYDVRRGPHSVGAHVRDAAAYVCWAFARAYTPETMLGAAPILAPALLTTACYDREVNCRRAASAAFQEMVGRHGSYPHGIEIITAADYFTLSARSNSYLKVAPFVAGFAEYRPHLAAHLLDTKLRHWERSLRCLAASALGELVPCEPDLVAAMVDELLPLCLDKALEVRHGACYGLGEAVLGLHRAGHPLSEAQAQAVSGHVLEIEKARLYRGKGGELMRAAACRLLECTAMAGVAITSAQRKKLLDSLDEQLRHPTADIQEAAAQALRAFTRSYMAAGSGPAVERTSVKYCGLLKDPNVAIRRGCALALGALPRALLQPKAELVVGALVSGLEIEENPDERDPESRVNAARALQNVCCELFADEDSERLETEGATELLEKALEGLLSALDDYSCDNRGDVGSWVREASMNSLPSVLRLYKVMAAPEGGAPELFATRAVAAMLKQAVERIGRVREASVKALRAVLIGTAGSCFEGLPAQERLQMLLQDEGCLTAASSGESLPNLILLMDVAEYRGHIFSGCVASIGGLDHTLAKTVSKATVASLKASGGAESAVELLLSAWESDPRSKRLALPFLKTSDLLFSSFDLHDGLTDRNTAFSRFLARTKDEIRGCTDVPRLFACVSLLCQLMSASGEVQKRSIGSLLGMLVNRFPKVRKFAAEQLYVKLMTLEGEIEGLGEEASEEAQGILAGTAWDGTLVAARSARAPLYPLFGIEPPKVKQSVVDREAREADKDENASYAALLADAERGLGSGM